MTAAAQMAGFDAGLVDRVRPLTGDRGWHLARRGPWWVALPPSHRQREQGWKLHLPATVVTAAELLGRAAPVLVERSCAFKFAATFSQVRLLGARECDRSAAGKFLTAYPDSDEHFRAVAGDLHEATLGLAGPAILSDRNYRPGSLVHYRFGGFAGRAALDNDGCYRQLLTAPDGSLVEDRREARFTAPDWAPSPLPERAPPVPTAPPATAAGGGRPRAVLLADRFLVREAIRHSAKGGVFLAQDTGTGAGTTGPAATPATPELLSGDALVGEAVVKQARPHTECDLSGHDSRDLLRNEAAVRGVLAPLGVAPEPLTIFEQDTHVFVAARRVPGEPLRHWVDTRVDGAGLPVADAVAMAARLVDVVDTVHRAGIVLRDLSPTNVVVTPDGRPYLVDLELAARAGEAGRRGGTPGYQAPEQARSTRDRTLARASEDLFSLGAICFLLATGSDPLLCDDGPDHRPVRDRLDAWLAVVAREGEAAHRLRQVVLGLVEEDPARRWSLARVREELRGQAGSTPVPPPAPRAVPEHPALPDDGILLADGVRYLLSRMTPDDPARLWPTGGNGAQTDPCNVQHGAAGVLAVLLRVAEVADPALPDVRPAIGAAAEWIVRRQEREPVTLPGLYFGRAGTAWALHDAGRFLGRGDLVGAAGRLVRALPGRWPNPDITHGAAGAGLAHLYLWWRTGGADLRERMEGYADALVEAAVRTPQGVTWQVPRTFASRLAGLTHLGFAHGVAGIGWFLLAAGTATGRDDYLDLAREAGATLCGAAAVDGHVPGTGAAFWPAAPGGGDRMPHWCSGSSGVGTFLLRLWRATGEDRFAEFSRAAARAVHRTRWRHLPGACHGIPGNGEFLLDAADLLGEPEYRRWALDLADMLRVRHAVVDGLALVPDETGRAVVADYNVGTAGTVAFLLRARHGGPRPWMADLPGEVAR